MDVINKKINTKSSTESEVVGASDFLLYTIWASYFLSAQGYKLHRNIFYQDNTSAISMLKNGMSSCGSKSRHIHIRYFFAKDVIEREKMEISHCPTDEMIADFYTKPLQGKQFNTLRQIIMGHGTVAAEERVGSEAKLTTGNRTKIVVSKVHSREVTKYGYKVSNNLR